MSLFQLHVLLIGMGITLSVVVIAYAAAMYPRHHDPGTLAMGGLAVVMLFALSAYLRWFLRKRRPRG